MHNFTRTSSGTNLSSKSIKSASYPTQKQPSMLDSANRIANRSRDLGERLRREHMQQQRQSPHNTSGWVINLFKQNNKTTYNAGWAKN